MRSEINEMVSIQWWQRAVSSPAKPLTGSPLARPALAGPLPEHCLLAQFVSRSITRQGLLLAILAGVAHLWAMMIKSKSLESFV